MKMNLRTTALAVIVFITTTKAGAQNTFPANGNVGIGTTSPNASAILDINSTTKGMLAPRMTKAQRDAIVTPATGLLIFQTNATPGLYIYSGTVWAPVSGSGANTSLSNLNAITKVNVNLVPDSNKVRNLGSGSLSWKNIYYNGSLYSGNYRILNGDITNANTSVGYYSGASNTTGPLIRPAGIPRFIQILQEATIRQSATMRSPRILQVEAIPAQALSPCIKIQQEAAMRPSASMRFIRTPSPTTIQLLVLMRFVMQQQ